MRHRTDPAAQTFAAPSRRLGLLLLFLLLCTALAAALSFLVLPDDEARAAQSKVEAEAMSLSGSPVVRSSSAASGGQEVATGIIPTTPLGCMGTTHR